MIFIFIRMYQDQKLIFPNFTLTAQRRPKQKHPNRINVPDPAPAKKKYNNKRNKKNNQSTTK
jgi:hypothetical protein